jgi:isochorismate synthase
MSAISFLKEELPKIDSKVSQKITTFNFPDIVLVDLLPFAATEEVFFFESKEENFSYLALGVSKYFLKSDIQNFLDNNVDDVLVYQDSFEEDSATLCYLPEWCLITKNGTTTLRVHQSLEYQSYSPSNIIFNLAVWESFIGPWISYEEKPESDEWGLMIKEAGRLLNKSELEKIVLHRKKIFTYDSPIEMMVLFREVYDANKNSSHFTVYNQLNYMEAFISLTPERLFTLKGQNLETVSLAGSIARGTDEESDKELEVQLNTSDKLTREHDIVTKAIQEKLGPVLKELTISPLVTMKLPYIQHRQATIKGVLKDTTTVLELIELLHPTPAVGGIPHDKAKIKILEIEKEKRGYYAGPVGVLSQGYSEIAVGIRSAMILGQNITVYGGAGIVAGSEAYEEWIETGTKMQPFIKVINKSTL